MRPRLYTEIASLLVAIAHCEQSGNEEWSLRHTSRLAALVRDRLPSGSGFDSGTKLDFERSTPDRLVFTTDFHHMNGEGFYDGWTEHDVIVTPSLAFGIEIRIAGRDRNGIKDYIHECFHSALTEPVAPEEATHGGIRLDVEILRGPPNETAESVAARVREALGHGYAVKVYSAFIAYPNPAAEPDAPAPSAATGKEGRMS